MTGETQSPPGAETGGPVYSASIENPEDAEFVDRNADACKRSSDPFGDIPPIELPESQKRRKRRKAKRPQGATSRQLASMRLRHLITVAHAFAAAGVIPDHEAWRGVVADLIASAPPSKRTGGRWQGLTLAAFSCALDNCGLYTTAAEVAAAFNEHFNRHRWLAHQAGVAMCDYFYPLTADELGARIGLTQDMRRELKVWTIGALGDTSQKRLNRRAKDKREKKAKARRAAGMRDNAQSIEARAPWEAEGIDRSTWFRRRKRAKANTQGATRATDLDPTYGYHYGAPIGIGAEHPAPLAEPDLAATTAAPDEAAASVSHSIAAVAGADDQAEQRAVGRGEHDGSAVAAREASARGEHDENELRKDFTVTERVAIGELLRAKLGERRGGDRRADQSGKISTLEEGQETRDLAAEKAGLGSGKTFEAAKTVIEHGAPELVEAMDKGERADLDADDWSRLHLALSRRKPACLLPHLII